MTTDTTALQERIARALFLSERWNWHDPRPDSKKTPEGDREQREKMAALWDAEAGKPWHESRWPSFRQEYPRLAAAVLPIIAAEVQAASEKAWDEGCAAAEQYYKRTAIGVPGSDPIPAPLNPQPRDRSPGMTTTDEQYVPSEARVCIDFCNAATARRALGGEKLTMEEADQAFARFMARVRRDAARKAEARIKAVRELHSESRIIPGTPVFGCAECGEPNETEPCATIRALEE